MPQIDVLKELGIIGHRPCGRYMVPDNEESWAPSGDWVKKSDVIQAIRRGDLIPRSKIEKRIEELKKYYNGNNTDVGQRERLHTSFTELRRLLEETKP